MADQAALLRVFADYARTISARYDIGTVLYRLTDQVVDVLDVDGAGVSLDDHGRLRFVTATDDRVVTVEERQIAVSAGPCHDAHRSGEVVTSADLTVESRWQEYTPVALEEGCRAVAGIPMRAGERSIGALNLYRYEPVEWRADDLQVAQVLTDMASGYIVNAEVISESLQLSTQLQTALDSRIVIEQAKGVLAERRHIAPAEAFRVLRAYARGANRKLHDVASDVVNGDLDPM